MSFIGESSVPVPPRGFYATGVIFSLKAEATSFFIDQLLH
jgi:hypothetical protein